MDGLSLPPSALLLFARLSRRRGLRLLLVLLSLLLLVFGTVTLAVHALSPDRTALRLISAGMLCAGLALCWRYLRVLRRGANRRSWAGFVEADIPGLAESLSTLVALQGSPTFVAQISRRAEEELERADVERLLAHFPIRRPLLALLVLGLSLIVAAVWLPGYAGTLGRVAAVWLPLSAANLLVSPGDTVIFRGDPLQVTARLDEQDSAPMECSLVMQQEGSPVARLAMQRQDNGTYITEIRGLARDATYALEMDGVRRAEYRVRVVESIELSQSPVLEVEPPPYAMSQGKARSVIKEAGEVTIPQFGRAQLHLSLSRRPVAASLDLKPVGAVTKSPPLSVPVELNDSGGLVAFAADDTGSFRASLRLEAEEGLQRELALGVWTLLADRPPTFRVPLRIEGLAPEDARIAVNDSLMGTAVVEDDLGLSALDVEARVNDAAVVVLPWLRLGGRTQATIADMIPLPHGLRSGDRLRLRLRLVDNRRLHKDELGEGRPATDLEPQVAYEPAPEGGTDRWIELRVDGRAEPLRARAVAARRDEARARLQELRAKIDSARQRALHLKASTRASGPEAERQARALQQQHDDILRHAVQSSRELATEPASAPLADRIMEIAHEEIAQAGMSLDRFLQEHRPAAERGQDLASVAEALAAALKRLDAVMERNQAVARERLDVLELEKLAAGQTDLEARLREMLASDAGGAESLALQADEEKIENELQRLREQIGMLEAARAQAEARGLAQRAAELAAQQRQAAAAMEKLPAKNAAGSTEAKVAAAADMKRAEELQQNADKLALDLRQMAGEATSGASKNAREAAHAAEEAARRMREAKSELAKGQPAAARAAADDAALKLEMAAKQMAATPASSDKGGMKDLDEAMRQARRARQNLAAAAPKLALPNMQQAAQSLKAAAQQMNAALRSAPIPGGRPAPGPLQAGQASSVDMLPTLPPGAGARSWGELPGELRTRLLQDLRSRYGDDYAELIRRYFERLSQQ